MADKNNQKISIEYQEIKAQILEELEKSNFDEAYHSIKVILDYPGRIENDDMWIDVLTLFKRIINGLEGDYLGQLIDDVIASLDSVEALYNLAYDLYERNMIGIAATLLKKANEIKPQDPKIVTELAIDLEMLMLNHEAYIILLEAKELIDSDELCRYLLGFNRLMMGNIDEPLHILPTLKNSDDTDIQFMFNTLKGMLNRALALKKVRTLDNKDLRGWHMVLNGSILLHLSPFGFDDAMFGRYAYIADSYNLIQEGLYRVKKVLEILDLKVPYILALPDRSSQILSLASSKFLEIPLKNWMDIDIDTPGLIVAYDLDEIKSEEILQEIADHRSGQILWAHASCWTDPFPFSPDITTYLYQSNVNPWDGGGMAFDKNEKKVTLTIADESSNEDITKLILEATIDKEYFDDIEDLISMIKALKILEYNDQPEIFKKAGRRMRQRLGSPVQSNRFA